MLAGLAQLAGLARLAWLAGQAGRPLMLLQTWFTCRIQTLQPLQELLVQAEGARRRPGLPSVQEQQLDPGQGAQVPRVAAHRQRRQAGGQV